MRLSRKLFAWTLVAVLCVGLGSARADGTPNITVSVSSASVLFGDPVHVTVTAANPPGTYGYNLTYRVVLPAGVTYAGGAATAPQQVANAPIGSETTLIFSNVSDLSPNSSRAIGFDLTYSQTTYDVGSTFPVAAQAFVNSDPRFVPKFDASGVYASGATGSTAEISGTQTINAIKVTKSEPSAEGEILRGLHDHQTVYTLNVANNSVNSTTGTTLDDFLPAGLEFLGCGNGTDDHTTNAPTNPGSTAEYPGSGPIVIAPLAGCVDPIAVDTFSGDPDGTGPLTSGVYTHVTWNVGALSPGQTRIFTYRAAVPLRANTMAFTGTKPTAASLGQGANLDNNSGAEVSDESSLTNGATAHGSYQGSTPVAVSDEGTLTRSAEDWLVHKSGSSGTLAEGAITLWTLTLQTSEYRFVDGATVTDTVPDGLCPLGASNFTTGNDPANDSECQPTGNPNDLPNPAYSSVTEHSDGTWTLVWDSSVLSRLAHTGVDDTISITYPTVTRTHYQQGFVPAGPILTADTVQNQVRTDALQFARCTAPGTPDCSTPGPTISHDVPNGDPIGDTSQADQTAVSPVIDKMVAASGSNCATAGYGNTVPHYHPGDRVCWLVRVDFPGAVDTAPQAVADFLPPGATYESGSEAAGPGDTVSSTLDASAALTDGALSWTVTGGHVSAGSLVFSRIFSTIAAPPGSPAPGDITGNLLKFSSTDTPGISSSLRDQADYVLDTPAVSLLKGVSTVVRGGSTVVGPLGANSDNISVQGGDQVTYRVDVTNSGAQDASNVEVRDILPFDCTIPVAITAISDSGTCVDGGLAPDQIQWTLPTLAAGTTTTLHYTATVPVDVGAARTFANHAGVRKFEGSTNLGGTYIYTPANNIDATDPTTPNAPAADDTSSVSTTNAGVVKGRSTEITEAGNSGAQATIGEEITYTLTATVPAGTTLHGTAQLTDTVDSSTRQPYVASSATATLNGGALPGGFTLDTSGATPKIVFPTDYANAAASGDDILVLTFRTNVADVAANTRTSGILTNQGKLTWTDPVIGAQTRTSNTVTTQIVEPRIAQAKSDDRNPARVSPGDVITYTLTTTNPTAPGRVSTAHDLVVSDVVPVGLTPIDVAPGNAQLANGAAVPGTGGAIWTSATRTIAKSVSSINPGASSAFSYRVIVDNPGVGGATKVNTATATATSLGFPADSDGERMSGVGYSASTTDTVRLATAAIAKAVSPTSATIGEPLSYTVRVTIPAGISLYDMTVVDVVPDSIDVDGYDSETCESGCPLVNPVNRYTPVVAGTTKLAWDLGDIGAPLSTPQVIALTYHGHLRATHRIGGAPVVAPQTPTNSATVSSNQTDVNGAFDAASIPTTFTDSSQPATAPVTVVEPSLVIDKKVKVGTAGSFVDGPASARSDSALTYQIVVTNTGSAPAYDAVVTDLPDAELTNVVLAAVAGTTVSDGWTSADPGIAWQIPGPIAAGGSVTLTYSASLVAAASLHDAETIDNTAAVPHSFGVPSATRAANAGDATFVYRDYTNGGSDSTQVVLDFPTFSTVKTTGAIGFPDTGIAEVGQSFSWRVVATNTSATATATAVHVTDTLPANWSYDNGTASISPGGSQEPVVTAHATGDDLDWTVATLAPGATATVTYTAHPLPAAASLPGTGANANVNSARVRTAMDEAGNSGNGDGAYGSTVDTAAATLHLPLLGIVKTPDHGAAVAGTTSSFSIAVHNSGSGIARNVDVMDVLPAGLGYAAASASAVPSTGFSETSVSGQTVHWTIATVAVGATVTITLPVAVAHDIADASTLTNTASTSSNELPTPVSDTGSLDIAAHADLSIVKSGAATYGEGASYVWHVRVRNLGPSDAQAANVGDTLPAGVTFASASAPCTAVGQVVACNLGTLAAGFDQTYDVSVAVTSGTTSSPLSNTAVVATTTTDTVAGNNSSTSTALPSPLADISVAKVATPPAILKGGRTSFAMTVHNAGPSIARSVTLSDTMPAGLSLVSATGTGCGTAGATVTCALGDLAAGGDSLVTVLADGVVNGPWLNTATAATPTTQPIGGGTPDSGSATVIVGPVAGLQLAKTAPAQIAAGGDLTWTLAVTNVGPDPASNVTIDDPLPSGTTFVSASPGCAPATAVVHCAVGDLAVGQSTTRTISATVPLVLADTTVLNTATTAADQGDDHPADNIASASTLVGPSADLGVVKTGPATAGAGGTVAWTLVATNAGPSAATGVTIVDTLPAGVTFVSATPAQGGCSAVGQAVGCALGAVANGGTAQIQLVGTVAAALEGTSIVNGASISGDQPDPAAANDQASATTAVVAPLASAFNLTFDKRVLGHSPPQLGVALRYGLTVSNSGPANAADVDVTDTLPSNLEFVSASLSGGTCTHADAVVTCHLDTLAAGAQGTAIVTTRPIAGGPVQNTASVQSAVADQKPADNVDAARASVSAPRARLSLAKTTARSAPLRAGQRIGYRIRVANPGRTAAAAVIVCDVLPASLVWVSTPGARFREGRACWTIGLLRAGQGRTLRVSARLIRGARGHRLVNVATATSENATMRHASAIVTVAPGEQNRNRRDGGVTG